MWGKNRKRRTSRIDTLVGQHSQLHGDIRFSGGLHVDGTVKGNVYAEQDGQSMLSLSDHGTIEGEVRVPHVLLNGTVVGDVYASEHVELAANARVTGNVYYSLIEMAIGAEVNGKLVHQDQEMAGSHEPPLPNEDAVLKAGE